MSRDAIKEKINEVAIMLMMTSEGDATGKSLLVELLADVEKLCQADPGLSRITTSAGFIAANKGENAFLTNLQDFITAANSILDSNDNVVLPGEENESKNTKKVVTQEIDQRFLAEYIETHSLLLEDFESSLLDYQINMEGGEELLKTCKRYLHNLKGDSGSIGLRDIEEVCHKLEDLLEQSNLDDMVAPLLIFKQWVSQTLQTYANGNPNTDSAAKFLKGIALLMTPRESPEIRKTATPIDEVTEGTSLGSYQLTGEREIFVEFAAEAEEHLSNVESVILDSEGNYSKDSIDTIFRGVHSIKGGSAYFTLEEMTSCSHILENFLSEVRDGKRELDSVLSSLLLRYIDLQKDVLARAKRASTGDCVIQRSSTSVNFLSDLELYRKGKLSSEKVEKVKAASTPETKGDSTESDGDSSKGEKLNLKTFVKVDTSRLDLLIDSIGEMVIYSSMLIRHCRELLKENESVMDATHRVEKFSRDLQDIGMSMRLVPIKGLFQKMSRLVWDTSKKLGKDVILNIEGEDTELDRNLIDKLADPLMHMVRNSLDHGIESASDRLAKGKSATGKIKLSAYHAGGSIHIRIEDDGKGLNPEKILAKAIEKGIVQEGQTLSRSEIQQLIFAPGFSTAAQVTDISGRGVGMDVVRRNVESLRGRIQIESEVDKGSVFTIEIPLTLAIIDGIQVKVGKEAFIIPSLSIVEFVRPTQSMVTNALDRGETLSFRNQYLPIYRIADLYGIKAIHTTPIEATMVVVETNKERVALMVDDILGECSTVIKSLGSLFEENKGIAGCSIMPQGHVALILDVRTLINLARNDYHLGSGRTCKPTSSITLTEGR